MKRIFQLGFLGLVLIMLCSAVSFASDGSTTDKESDQNSIAVALQNSNQGETILGLDYFGVDGIKFSYPLTGIWTEWEHINYPAIRTNTYSFKAANGIQGHTKKEYIVPWRYQNGLTHSDKELVVHKPYNACLCYCKSLLKVARSPTG